MNQINGETTILVFSSSHIHTPLLHRRHLVLDAIFDNKGLFMNLISFLVLFLRDGSLILSAYSAGILLI